MPTKSHEASATAAEPMRTGAWRKGTSLIVRSHVANLPDACLRCGSDDNTRRINYNLRCRPQPWMLLLPYWAPFSPSVQIKPALCSKHYRQEKASRWFGHGLLVAMAVIMLGPILMIKQLNEVVSVLLVLTGIAMLPIWVYYRTFRYKVLHATKIKKTDALIEDAPSTVLECLPEPP